MAWSLSVSGWRGLSRRNLYQTDIVGSISTARPGRWNECPFHPNNKGRYFSDRKRRLTERIFKIKREEQITMRFGGTLLAVRDHDAPAAHSHSRLQLPYPVSIENRFLASSAGLQEPKNSIIMYNIKNNRINS